MATSTVSPWYVYLLYSKRADVYYIGITNDMRARLQAHNEGNGAKFTRGRGPWRVEAVIPFKTKSEALREELRLKKLSRKKKLDCFAARYNHEVREPLGR